MTALSINKKIYELLSNDATLNTLVSGQIYPLVAEENTKFPFIIFKRNTLQVNYCKDGVVNDLANISVAIASTKYYECVKIAEKVREILELKRNDYFKKITVASVNEDFIENAYVIELTFNVTL